MPQDEKKPRTAENQFRTKKFRIHPDVVVEETPQDSPGRFNGKVSPPKKLKEYTIAKKVYVDKNGVLLQESLKKIKSDSISKDTSIDTSKGPKSASIKKKI